MSVLAITHKTSAKHHPNTKVFLPVSEKHVAFGMWQNHRGGVGSNFDGPSSTAQRIIASPAQSWRVQLGARVADVAQGCLRDHRCRKKGGLNATSCHFCAKIIPPAAWSQYIDIHLAFRKPHTRPTPSSPSLSTSWRHAFARITRPECL